MAQPNADLVRALKGVTKKWLELISKDDMLTELQEILNAAILDRHYPQYDDIFNFARFSFDNTKVVILGMDPYPNPGDAHGLSFSTKNTTCPASLARVYNVMIKEKLLEQRPEQFDLSYLAAQGFILLNSALTVRTQQPGSHMKLWSSWTDRLIKNISDAAPPGTIWCLWGGDAQKKEYLIDAKRHMVLKAAHPVAPVKPNFINCDHFAHIAKKYPDIIWDPTKTDTDLFTDCSARGNQFATCNASWGVVCTKGLLKGKTWAGVVAPAQIEYKDKVETARPTNIRGEAHALIRAMEIAAGLPVKRVRIYSDSKFWIHDMLREHIPGWLERGSAWTSHKNADLAERFWTLAQLLKDKVEFRFVNAWHDRDRPDDGTEDLYWWLGNRAAEEAAERVLGL